VLAGKCLLLIEGEERPLKAWDFGARKGWPDTGVVYTRSEVALLPRRGGREGDDGFGRGVCPLPEVAARPPENRDDLPWAEP
jgi:hypothetical protein